MKEMFGGLFEYSDEGNLEDFITYVDKEKALQIIETSITFCQQSGVYTLEEAYFLYQMLKHLKVK